VPVSPSGEDSALSEVRANGVTSPIFEMPLTNIGLRSKPRATPGSRGAVCSMASCLPGEARLAILAPMTKTETNAIEEAYKDNLGKMLNALFDAYIEGQGPASDVARKAANDRFVKGLKILRDTKDSVTKLLGP